MKKAILVLCILFTALFSHAQFKGGIGDGYNSKTSTRNIIFNACNVVPLTEIGYCRCQTFYVAFAPNFVATAGNVFSVQLSDNNGSFAVPTIIGSLSSTSGGTITCIIPSVIVASDGYSIRLTCTQPTVLNGASQRLGIVL